MKPPSLIKTAWKLYENVICCLVESTSISCETADEFVIKSCVENAKLIRPPSLKHTVAQYMPRLITHVTVNKHWANQLAIKHVVKIFLFQNKKSLQIVNKRLHATYNIPQTIIKIFWTFLTGILKITSKF